MDSERGAMGITVHQRIAIITGGANGIGRATARAFADAGATVVIWDRAVEAGTALAAEIEATGQQAVFADVNIADSAAVQHAVAEVITRFGAVDILINNAGITRDAQLVTFKHGELAGSMSEADFDAVIDVNLKGVFVCAQAVAPIMMKQARGRIINAASVVGLYGNFGQTNYVATKSGVIGMTKVWARELGRRGITVNAVAPGFITTEMTSQMPQATLAQMQAHTPVGRLGTPEDVAHAYLFLAADESAFINGAVLSVDGGLVLGT